MDSASASPVDPARRVQVWPPRRRRPGAAAAAPERARRARLTAQVRVVIVDDDDDIREVLTVFLRDEGYDVHAAASGAEAIALMRSMAEPPDVALVDIVMPEMSGFEVIEEMRRTPRLAGVPVAVITGLPHALYREKQVAAWLIKPPSVVELLGTVARLTGRA